jgi:hypothetical protein
MAVTAVFTRNHRAAGQRWQYLALCLVAPAGALANAIRFKTFTWTVAFAKPKITGKLDDSYAQQSGLSSIARLPAGSIELT